MNFPNLDSLIMKRNTHTLNQIKSQDKNLEIKAIVLNRIETVPMKHKQSVLHKLLISDQTGSMFLNVFDDRGQALVPGDIIYINGAYATKYKEQTILYEGKQSILLRIGEYFFEYSREPNFSLQN